MADREIRRNGFASAYGRFYALAGSWGTRVEVVDARSLRQMFLPKLTLEGSKKLSDQRDFVRGQLQHYDVAFDESQFSGQGTLLFKKLLAAGKCDKVPEHISRLRKEMHMEWLDQLTPERLASHPDWIMQRYFLHGSGGPDRGKTPSPIGFPFSPSYGRHGAKQLREAADAIRGLWCATGYGRDTQMVYLGWDREAVEREARHHAANEERARRAREGERNNRRAKMHSRFLSHLARTQVLGAPTEGTSPVGSYIVDCDEIRREWPGESEDMVLDIRESGDYGVFEASFHFGVVEGVMILSAQKSAIAAHYTKFDGDDGCCESDYDDYDDDDNDVDDHDCEGQHGSDSDECDGSSTSSAHGQNKAPAASREKKPSVVVRGKARVLYLEWKGREVVGEQVILADLHRGHVVFDSPRCLSLKATVEIPFVGASVQLTARKVSEVPRQFSKSWSSYSEARYERERVGRWR